MNRILCWATALAVTAALAMTQDVALARDSQTGATAQAASVASCVSTKRPRSLGDLLARDTPLADRRVEAAATALDSAGSSLVSGARDQSLMVDGCGRMLFSDQFERGVVGRSTPDTDGTASGTGSRSVHHEEDPEPPASFDPFNLSSRPGSAHTIYLDFDGERIANTAWNEMYSSGAPFWAESFDEDGQAGLSKEEAAKIWAAWETTAESYSYFDVNVTTVDPGIDAIERTSSTDDRYGIHVVVTTENNPIASVCGCGGIAYLGSISPSSDYSRLQPAFAWTSGSVYPGHVMGNIAAHETGHSFGLVHDGHYQDEYYGGFGHYEDHPIDAQWAPIMGASYGFAQWSNSDYPGATNDQDDLEVIAGTVGTIGDDLQADTGPVNVVPGQPISGSISSRADTDTFAVDLEAGETYDLSASTLQAGSLIQELTVTGPDGRVEGSDFGYVDDLERPPYRTATVRVAVPADASGGTVRYLATVDGVPSNTQYGSRSDYGSLGTFTFKARPVDRPSIMLDPDTTLTVGVKAGGAVFARTDGGTSDPIDPDRDYYSWYVTGDVPGVTFVSTWDPQKRLLVYGTPTQAGTFPVTLAVESPNGETSQATVDVVVADAAPPAPMVFVTGAKIQAHKGLALRSHLRVEGGVGPFGWTWVGSLPRGMGLRLGHTSQVLLHGRPQETGRFVFAVSATDAAGQRVKRTFTIKVRK